MKKSISKTAIFVLIAMVIGTIVFHALENWSWVDSFYFTSVTMLTIGSNSLVPSTDISKIFTVIFAFSTIGLVLYTITSIARQKTNISGQIKSLISKEITKLHHKSSKKTNPKKNSKKKKSKWLFFN